MTEIQILKGPGGKAVIITKGPDHLWRDDDGCVYAMADRELIADDKDAAGVGWFSLPPDHWLSKATAPHDFMYSSLAYQLTHPRSEADGDSLRNMEIAAGNDVLKLGEARAAYWLERLFGHIWWEGPWFEFPETSRNKDL